METENAPQAAPTVVTSANKKEALKAFKVCKIEGCKNPHHARGLCHEHYDQAKRAEKPKACKVAGCKEAVAHRGLCLAHQDADVPAKAKKEPKAKAPKAPKPPKAAKPPKAPKAPRPSGLNAAHALLVKNGKGMHIKDITEAVIKSGAWSPKGKTPQMTLGAAIYTEIKKKGTGSRFRKSAERGTFEVNG